MLPIGEMMARLQGIQKGLSITTIDEVVEDAPVVVPFPSSIAKAYQHFPPKSAPPADFPCWINEWSAPTITFNSALLAGEFAIHMQLLIDDADADRAAAIATAYYEALVTALTQNIKLGAWGPATVRSLRGAEPTLAGIQYPAERGTVYIGLDLYLDLYLNKSATMRP